MTIIQKDVEKSLQQLDDDFKTRVLLDTSRPDIYTILLIGYYSGMQTIMFEILENSDADFEKKYKDRMECILDSLTKFKTKRPL